MDADLEGASILFSVLIPSSHFNIDIDPDANYFNSNYGNDNSKYFSIDDFNEFLKENSSKISFFHHNIRSFHANSDLTLSIFSSAQYYPDVLVFSETWFTQFYQGSIEGYESFHTIRNYGRSGGVSVYTKENFTSKIIANCSFSNENIEIVSVES